MKLLNLFHARQMIDKKNISVYIVNFVRLFSGANCVGSSLLCRHSFGSSHNLSSPTNICWNEQPLLFKEMDQSQAVYHGTVVNGWNCWPSVRKLLGFFYGQLLVACQLTGNLQYFSRFGRSCYLFFNISRCMLFFFLAHWVTAKLIL